MKLVRRTEELLVAPEKISIRSILTLDKYYRIKFSQKPNTIKLNMATENSLRQQLGIPLQPNVKTVFGINILIDPSLPTGEWRLGYVKEIIYEVQDND